MRTSLLFSLPLLSIALLASCTAGPLEGDWFPCKDEACTTLDDEGVRFTAGGRWAALDAPGGEYEPGEPCELERVRGTYTLEGNTLTLHLDGSAETYSVKISFDGDDLLVRGEPQVTVACIEAPTREGSTSGPDSACKEEPGESKLIRFRRVGDAGEVPKGGGPLDDDRVSGSSATIEPPPPEGD